MAFDFPKHGSKAGEHMTPDVFECLARWRDLPSRSEAAASAKRLMETSTAGMTGVYSMTLTADDSVALCFYGIRGGFRVIWNFGKCS